MRSRLEKVDRSDRGDLELSWLDHDDHGRRSPAHAMPDARSRRAAGVGATLFAAVDERVGVAGYEGYPDLTLTTDTFQNFTY